MLIYLSIDRNSQFVYHTNSHITLGLPVSEVPWDLENERKGNTLSQRVFVGKRPKLLYLGVANKCCAFKIDRLMLYPSASEFERLNKIYD